MKTIRIGWIETEKIREKRRERERKKGRRDTQGGLFKKKKAVKPKPDIEGRQRTEMTCREEKRRKEEGDKDKETEEEG